MSACPDVLTLQACVDRELSPEQREAVLAHLAGCPRCARVAAGLAGVAEPLRGLAEAEAPVGLADRILDAVSGLEPVAALTCKQAARLASVATDGGLSFAEAEQLEAHLTR